MTEYRRAIVEGATYFFTVNGAKRHGNRLWVDRIDVLRRVLRKVKNFAIEATVVLPEHLPCLWTLPPDDGDYKTRWGLIKAGFSRAIPGGDRRSMSRLRRGERGIWQRRYGEHLIRDDADFERHVDYVH